MRKPTIGAKTTAIVFSIICCCQFLLFLMSVEAAPKSKPNVLFIISDDLNISLGCYGYSWVKTPNIDRLARNGIQFNAAYAAFTLCNPARTSLLSGFTPETTGVQNNSTRPEGLKWIPDYFKEAGYRTGSIGKITHGAFADSMTADVYETSDDVGGFNYALVCSNPDLSCQVKIKDKLDMDARVSKHAVKFIKKSDGPFFLAVGFSKPHAPNWAPKRYFDLYDPQDIPLPVPIGDDGMTDQQRREARLAYYACVSFVDTQVGILLDTLDELGIADNTIVVFSGDHGYLLGEHGIWNKHELFNLTSRVPLIVSGPGIHRSTTQGIVQHIDILPTLLDLCDIPKPFFEGISFVPLIKNPDRAWRSAAFVESIANKKSSVDHAVYTERYTYIEAETGTFLYDRWSDPNETVNITDMDLRLKLHNLLIHGIQPL